MRQFFIDLIDRESIESQVFSRKSEIHFGNTRVVSYKIKMLTYIFLFLLNIYFVFNVYCMVPSKVLNGNVHGYY